MKYNEMFEKVKDFLSQYETDDEQLNYDAYHLLNFIKQELNFAISESESQTSGSEE